ncbi:Uncharacterised protein [uncultured archaeon]|nr:Uncharacterised protein [uncultured archaeon]
MKKENINKAIKRVKQAYGIETLETKASSEPILDLETIKHQRFTDKIVHSVDYIGFIAIYGSAISYGIYHTATKVPEVVTKLGLVYSDIYQYIEPFIRS